MAKRFKLQVFYILLLLFNTLYAICFLWSVRYFLLRFTGIKVGAKSCVQKAKFFSFGKMTIGQNTIVNSGCYLDNRRGITIGDNVVIAHDTKIYTLGHDFNDISFITKGSPVVIEDFVVVFSNAFIMPGVTIKKGAVVLPGSVVTKDVDEMAVVGGNPAKLVRRRENLHYEKEVFRYWFSI